MIGVRIKVQLDNENWSDFEFDNQGELSVILNVNDIEKILLRRGLLKDDDYIHSIDKVEEVYGKTK